MGYLHNTDVATVQAAITLYALVMASFMITGGKIGDIVGRKWAFRIGLIIYGIGSLLTAISPTMIVLFLGWSILEGFGATLVMPAIQTYLPASFHTSLNRFAYSIPIIFPHSPKAHYPGRVTRTYCRAFTGYRNH